MGSAPELHSNGRLQEILERSELLTRRSPALDRVLRLATLSTEAAHADLCAWTSPMSVISSGELPSSSASSWPAHALGLAAQDADARLVPSLYDVGLSIPGSALAAPVRLSDGTLFGLLRLFAYPGHTWTERDLALARESAESVAFVLDLLLLESAARNTQSDLEETRRAWYTLLGNLPGMVYRCVPSPLGWTMEFVSEGARELTGYDPRDLVGNWNLSYAVILAPEDLDRIRSEIENAVQERRSYRFTYRITTADGESKWVWEQGEPVFSSDGQFSALEGFVTDISDQKRAEEKLAQQAEELRQLSLTDTLTGLRNRRAFEQLATHHLTMSRRTGKPFALLFIDLDGMKTINDRLGHAFGDQALLETAEVLSSTCRDSDIVARLAGDEFVILAPDTDLPGAYSLMDRLEGRVARQNTLPGRRFRLSLSIGVISSAHCPSESLEEILELADQQMYVQKEEKKAEGGRTSTEIFPDDPNSP